MSGVPTGQTMLKAALALADAGIPLVRVHYAKDGGCSCSKGKNCDKAAKHPVGAEWQNAATTDEATIRSRWKDQPWNIGTIVRDQGTITVLDVEGPKGHAIDGRPAFGLLAEGLRMAEYPRSHTPSGGFHVWGRRPAEIDRLVDPAPGIEVFGEGARFKMIVLPPSSTPTGKYTWVREGFEPEELGDLRPFPPQLWNGATVANGQALQPISVPTAPVSRHGLMLSIAGAMRRFGAAPAEILAAITAMKTERGWSDKPDDELDRIARDIGAKPDGATAAALSRMADLGEQLRNAVSEGDLVKAGTVVTAAAREARASAPEVAQRWRAIDQALAEPDPPLAALWPGIVFCGGFTLFAAAPKAGKTWLLVAWIATLGRGAAWLGFAPLGRPVRVLLVTEEPLFIVKAQARLFGIQRNVDVLTLDGIAAGTSWPALVDAAAERAAEIGAELMVFDTISTLAGIGDENSASDVNAALRPLLMASRASNLAVVGVHHAGRSGGIRGSTVFEAVPDVLVEVRLDKSASRRRALHVRSRLEGAPERPVTVEWTPQEGSSCAGYRLAGSDHGAGTQPKTLELDNRIVGEVEQAVADGGDWMTAARIVERLGSAAGRIRGRLAALVAEERLDRKAGPGRGRGYLYGPAEGKADPIGRGGPVLNLPPEPVLPAPTGPIPVPCGSDAGSPNLSNLPRGAVSPRAGTGVASRTTPREDRETFGFLRPDESRRPWREDAVVCSGCGEQTYATSGTCDACGDRAEVTP